MNKVKPVQAVHVGDDPNSDIGGALAVGMRAVWINRHRKPWLGTKAPEVTITSWFELEEWLKL